MLMQTSAGCADRCVMHCRFWCAHQAGHSSRASLGLGGSDLSTASQGRAFSVPCVHPGEPLLTLQKCPLTCQ